MGWRVQATDRQTLGARRVLDEGRACCAAGVADACCGVSSGGDSPQTRSALWPAGYKPALNPLEPKTVSRSQPRGFPTLLPILCQPNRGREAPAKGQTLLAEAGTRGGGRGALCCPGRQVQSRPDTGVASHPDPFAQNTRHMKQGGFPPAVTEPTGSSGEAASPRSGRSGGPGRGQHATQIHEGPTSPDKPLGRVLRGSAWAMRPRQGAPHLRPSAATFCRPAPPSAPATGSISEQGGGRELGMPPLPTRAPSGPAP